MSFHVLGSNLTMPEGPEVRIITEYLNRKMEGRQLEAIEWDLHSKYHSYHETLPGYELFRSHLPATFHGVSCKGKLIIFHLRSKHGQSIYITSSLGLEGHWVFKPGKHSNLWFRLDRNERLYFNDSRHFGNIQCYAQPDQLVGLRKKLRKIGPDLLAAMIRMVQDDCVIPIDLYQAWHSQIRNKRRAQKQICDFLMNQAHFSGIGNYLKAEILYRARIRPDRTLEKLTDQEIDRLLQTSLETIYDAYQAQGLTIKSFQVPDGGPGGFQVKVYGKTEDPDGHPVERSVFKDKRTTHWVPAIQT